MSIDLGIFYPKDWAGKPPHMASHDLEIWIRYREKHAHEFIGFYFDAACGTPAEVPPGTPENLARDWIRITSKRIDVIGIKTNEIWIIEVRPDASSGALGTILTYFECARKEPPDSRLIVPVIISDRFDPDIIENAKSFGIILIRA